jgi:hypothetical protein
MPIARVGKFLETPDLGITYSLGIESGMVDDCIEEIQRRGIQGVFGSSCFGFREETLDFLNRIPATEQVWFWAIDLKDTSGLYALGELRRFGIHERRAPIDFSRFPKLHSMVWHPRTKDSGIEHLRSLSQLDLWRFKPKSKNYEDLQLPLSIEKLEINWSNPADLQGFPPLPNLRELQFHYCRNLVSLDSIADFAPNLRKLVVTRCPNLVSYASTNELALEHLYINIKNKAVANKRMESNG